MSGLRSFLDLLTSPLPQSPEKQRQTARTALVVAALGIVVITLVVGQSQTMTNPRVQILAATVALAGLTSLAPPRARVLRAGSVVMILTQAISIVLASGWSHLLAQPLILMALLYAALFYDRARFTLAAGAALAALVWLYLGSGQSSAALASMLAVALLWGTLSGIVHCMVGRMRTASQTDGMTGLWDHATFWRLAQAEHERGIRHDRCYSVLMLDLDHFKKVNDEHGHRAGDAVLAVVARTLIERTRVSDLVARYGGEEFVVLLPETDRAGAALVAESIRAIIAAADTPVPVTVSIGVASSREAPAGPEEVVQAADQALYEAKQAGRNTVVVREPNENGMRLIDLTH